MIRDFSSAVSRLREAKASATPAGAADPASHIEVVAAQIDAIGRGDLGAVFADAHPDIELEIFAPPEFPWLRKARGLDELRRAVETNFGSVQDQRPEISSVVAQGDTVVLLGRERGTIRETGAAYDVEFVQRFTFREGRLAALRIIAAKAQ